MGFFKCCVGGCNATSETHRLFSLPKDDTLRTLWMSFLVPTNSLLIGLSKEQLLRRRVCEKHFDKQQFDYQGKRLRLSYPCLLTDAEIAHGVPLSSPGTVHNALSDHSYQLIMDEDDSDDDSVSTLVIGRAGENIHGHPSCSKSQPIFSIKESQRDKFHTGAASSMETTAKVVEFLTCYLIASIAILVVQQKANCEKQSKSIHHIEHFGLRPPEKKKKS